MRPSSPPRRALLVSALLVAATAASSAQAPKPRLYIKGDIVVNTETIHNQNRPSVAPGENGRHLVVWNSDADEEFFNDIKGQLFERDGSKIGEEFQIDQAGTGRILFTPRVVSADQGYIVAWADFNQTITDSEIHFRPIDFEGNFLADAIQVNTYTPGQQRLPSLAAAPGGSFVVVYESDDPEGDGRRIVGQRYAGDFQKVGDEFVVAGIDDGGDYFPSVAYSDEGTFVVTWDSFYGAAFGYEVSAQMYDDDGPVGGAFSISGLIAGHQRQPQVVSLQNDAEPDDWLFAYENGSQIVMRARRNGALVSQILVNSPTLAARANPSLSASSFENLIGVSWDCLGKDDPTDPAGSGIFTRLYKRDESDRLSEATDELPVNSQTSGPQLLSQVAIGPDGEVLIVWQSSGQDGHADAVISALLNDPASLGPLIDTEPSEGASNVNGVADPLERVLWINRVRNNVPLLLTVNATIVPEPLPTDLAAGSGSVIDDDTADFGSVAGDSQADCFGATGDCYEVTLAGPRPGPHWDESFRETLSTGAEKTWVLHVGESFADVPTTNLFYAFIENIFHNGVTAGGACGGYCPTDGVKRQQMAVFLLKARFGASFTPPPATGTIFTDVTLANPFASWIEALFLLGITGGCSGGPPPAPTQFCPEAIVNRQQMAVFLLKTLEGPLYTPPAATGIFQDVPDTNPFRPWIEELYNRQVTGGCVPAPLQYCPGNPTNRQQMAAFLVKTFGLLLYGP